MSFFPLSGKLLTESTFLNYISRVNEEFIALDSVEHESLMEKGQAFKLTTKEWLTKCKEENTVREENGVTQSFRVYALNRIMALVNFDIGNYLNDRKAGKIKDSQQFFEEVSTVRDYISKAPYLAPVAQELVAALNAIPKDASPSEKASDNIVSADGEDTLRWNGSLPSLCSLFKDLAAKKTGKAGKPYLDYSPKELGVFILKHFRDANGEMFPIASIKTSLDAAVDDKKGSKDRIKLS
jgi:hypothetical protein